MKKSALALAVLAVLYGCGSDDPALPQLSEAQGTSLTSCTDLAVRIGIANTVITGATDIAAGVLTVAGTPVPAHCRVTGRMFDRTGPIDGRAYAIGFEMRLPTVWNGRFFYQANGGLDGNVGTAAGPVGGGGPLDHALRRGFAVISSDAGHAGSLGPFFGVDPQARLDYGYQAVGKLTPMAKALIATAYGKGPDRSYIGGCSNGGRHAMVAAARYADQYDGFLIGNPGTRLPLAAIANIAGAQAYNTVATTPGDLGSGFTQAERALVSNAVLARCDALDGVADGIVQDTDGCRNSFDLARDVTTCSAARDGSCLTAAQKSVVTQLFRGATTSTGTTIYTSFPWDNGLATAGWAGWKFSNSLTLDSGAVGLVFQAPPESPAGFNGPAFTLGRSVDAMLAGVQATNGLYTESAMSFMTPPDPSNLSTLRDRGAKLMLYHGTADPIFSSDDSQGWYESLGRANGGDASDFARFYRVPGMNHCSGGPSTDQFDMLGALVDWVESGQRPDRVVASARGPGNAGGVNGDVPTGWSPNRTRPLCPYPKVARYVGSGSAEDAASFECR